MNLHVTTDTAKWYKNELSITTSGFIRFFPRYGFGGHIPGFSIGINQEHPKKIHVSTEVENITFYIEREDAWYFDDMKEISIEFNQQLNEPEFIFKED